VSKHACFETDDKNSALPRKKLIGKYEPLNQIY